MMWMDALEGRSTPPLKPEELSELATPDPVSPDPEGPASPDPESDSEPEEEPASPMYHVVFSDISDDDVNYGDNSNEHDRDVQLHYTGII